MKEKKSFKPGDEIMTFLKPMKGKSIHYQKDLHVMLKEIL